MGNRTQRVDSVAGTTAYAFDNANRLTAAGGQTYTSDADGNTLTGGGRTNAWDAQNRLVSSLMNGTSSAFTYGADGLRRSSTVTPGGGSAVTTRFCYDGQTMVRSLRQNGQGAWQAAATYLTGPRGMEYRRDDLAGQVRWYVYDGLGSVVGELDPAGNLTAGKKYDVYGAERQGGTGTATTRQGFCGSLGHIADAETGLVYMRARYYDPALGRFISQDPSIHGINWFVYASNNPTNRADANGKDDVALEILGGWLWNEGITMLTKGAGEVAKAGAAMALTQVQSLAAQGVIPAPIVEFISKLAEAVEARSMEQGIFMMVASLNLLMVGAMITACGADSPIEALEILAGGSVAGLGGAGRLAGPISKL